MFFAPKGNLLTNGDFEDDAIGAPPEGWHSVNVTVGDKDTAFTGNRAALLGGCNPCEASVLYQDVNVCPLRKYQLTFQASGLSPRAADIFAEVRWLDEDCTDIGLGLRILVGAAAIGEVCEGVWNPQSHVTDWAPIRVCIARVFFVRAGRPESGANVLDSVSLAEIC